MCDNLDGGDSKNNYDGEEQTHDMANRFGNRASLFVLATWTLGDHVAPDQEVLMMMIYILIMMKCVSRKIITPSLESPVTTLYNSRLVFMVFHSTRLVFHGYRSVFMGFQGSRWVFMVNGS